MKPEDLNDAIGDIEEKHVADAKEEKERTKKRGWVKWAAIAACLAVVCAVAIPMLVNDKNTVTTEETAESAENIRLAKIEGAEVPLEIKQKGEAQEAAIAAGELIFNTAELVKNDMDVTVKPYDRPLPQENELPIDFAGGGKDPIVTATGRGYSELAGNIPGDWKRQSCCLTYTSGSEVPHDCVLEYVTPENAKIRIACSATEAPLRDFYLEGGKVASLVNGTAVILTDAQGSFFAEYDFDGLHYDVEITGADRAVISQILDALLK